MGLEYTSYRSVGVNSLSEILACKTNRVEPIQVIKMPIMSIFSNLSFSMQTENMHVITMVTELVPAIKIWLLNPTAIVLARQLKRIASKPNIQYLSKNIILLLDSPLAYRLCAIFIRINADAVRQLAKIPMHNGPNIY